MRNNSLWLGVRISRLRRCALLNSEDASAYGVDLTSGVLTRVPGGSNFGGTQLSAFVVVPSPQFGYATANGNRGALVAVKRLTVLNRQPPLAHFERRT